MKKQREGDQEQRRRTAREAQAQGKTASELGGTTGASKQRHHVKSGASHTERFETQKEGKHAATGEGERRQRPHSVD